MKNIIQLEDHDFTVKSTNWKKSVGIINIDGEEKKIKIKTNPQGDIWEIDEGEFKGCQHFTWDAGMRETKKKGKRLPTQEECRVIVENLTKVDEDGYFSEPIHEKLGLSLAGYRLWNNGQYYYQGTFGYYWSSSPTSTNSYDAYFYAGGGNIANNNNRGTGFSCRCIKELGKEEDEQSEEVEREVSDSSSDTTWEFSETINMLRLKKEKYELKAKDIQKAIDIIYNIK